MAKLSLCPWQHCQNVSLQELAEMRGNQITDLTRAPAIILFACRKPGEFPQEYLQTTEI